MSATSPWRTIAARIRKSSRISPPSSTASRSGLSERGDGSSMPGEITAEDVVIRPSRDADIATIAAIYGHHVLHGVASFEEVPPSADEIGRRRADILARDLPYLVAERARQVVGYCYAGPFRTRSAYRFALEDSIYID